MDRPVRPRLAIFAGAVDRIDDPHPRHRKAGPVAFHLFGQEPVRRALFAQGVNEELVGGGIACRAERLGLEHRALAHGDEQTPRHFGKMRGERGIGQLGGHLSDPRAGYRRSAAPLLPGW